MKFTLLLFFFSCFCQQSFAERQIKYRMTSFGKGQLSGLQLVNSKSEGKPLRVSQGYVNDPVIATLRNDSFLDFYDVKKTGEEDVPVCSVQIPANVSSKILILMIQDGDSIQPQLIDMRAQNMRDGKELYMNKLNTPVAVRFSQENEGKKKQWTKAVKIDPGKSKQITPPGNGAFYKEISARNKKTKKYQPFASSLDSAAKLGPRLVFCYMKKGAKKPSIAKITIHKFVEPAASNN